MEPPARRCVIASSHLHHGAPCTSRLSTRPRPGLASGGFRYGLRLSSSVARKTKLPRPDQSLTRLRLVLCIFCIWLPGVPPGRLRLPSSASFKHYTFHLCRRFLVHCGHPNAFKCTHTTNLHEPRATYPCACTHTYVVLEVAPVATECWSVFARAARVCSVPREGVVFVSDLDTSKQAARP